MSEDARWAVREYRRVGVGYLRGLEIAIEELGESVSESARRDVGECRGSVSESARWAVGEFR